MNDRERLVRLCIRGLETRGLTSDQRYKERLKKELKAVDEQAEHEYLLSLYDRFRHEGLIFPSNEHNNLIDYLLGLTKEFNIDKPNAYAQGESPDIDIDYLKIVRNYLKRDWAARTFGQEYICEISTYGTLGIKSAMLDTARVLGFPKDEIQPITAKMEDKDDEGHLLDWDAALRLYADFAAYCESHPEVARDAKLSLDRNKSNGIHAGGLIISSHRIDGFVPLEVRKVDKKTNPKGIIVAAWPEGLATQDLGPVGLIKFDLLVVNNLMQIAIACKLIKERYGLKSICALPGDWDWSDTAYLNDPKALEMANRADLKCVFQFDGEGIRKLVKRGGVESFDDLATYTALYRPGPLMMGMDARYCKRKKGEEPYSLHPAMEPILGKTYGVMAYQEQVMDILRVVGNIPDMLTEKVRKAISKKKVAQFIKYKQMFLENGQKNLNANLDYVTNLWEQIEAFAEYGFNKSHAYAYTYISSRLLWLKAHYPTEFYAAVLMNESKVEKYRGYKLDAKYHDVNVKPVHINKSKANFHIVGQDIHFGFSNIKGVGNEVADRIAEFQPYTGFTDFLQRFGTDAKVVKPLVALGVFEEEYDRETLYKFYAYYKDQTSKRAARQKRYETSVEKKLQDLREMLLTEVAESHPEFEQMCAFTDEAKELWEKNFATVMIDQPYKYKGEERIRQVSFAKLLHKVDEAREKTIRNFNAKETDAEETPLTLDNFNVLMAPKIKPEILEVMQDSMEVDGVVTYPKAEDEFYGFKWTHELETCPNFEGATIDKLLEDAEKGMPVGMVEVKVIAVRKRTSKKGVEFYSVDIEDANCKKMQVNVWLDDYLRWKEELVAGNLLKMRVRPPSGGFNTLTFEAPQKRHREKSLPKDKNDDYRIIVMKKREKPKSKVQDLTDLIFNDDAVEQLR